MFLELDASQILATAERLRDRIRERFPVANLARVADELVAVTRAHAARSAAIRRPNFVPRIVGTLLLLVAIAAITLSAMAVHPQLGDNWRLTDLLTAIDSVLGSLVFVGAGFAFVWTLDVRSKRRKCLDALHEMRAMAHIVDMHQLTKDPDPQLLQPGQETASSPERRLDRFQLNRYLDYCSEMLSLIGKVAALYVQGFPDTVALAAVDDIEDLTTSLSRKIWQKIVVLQQTAPAPGLLPPPPPMPTPPPAPVKVP